MRNRLHNRLARIRLIARRSPLKAIYHCEKLELVACANNLTALQLDALYLRYFTMERLGEAEALLNPLQYGLSLAEECRLLGQAASMLEALGRIHYTKGAYRDAINYWTKCIDIGDSVEDKKSAIEARIGLGQLYDALGHKKTAKRFHLDAAALMGKINDPYLVAKLAINIGYNQSLTGNIESAKQQFCQALAVSKAGNIPEYEAEAYLHLGLLAFDEPNFLEAETLTIQAIQIAVVSNNKWAHSAALNSLGNILVAQKKIEQAIPVYQQALECAVKVGSLPQQSQCLAALSNLAEIQNDLRAALDYAREQMALSKTLSNELGGSDQLRLLQQYDLSQKSPIEMLLNLSSSPDIEGHDIDENLQRISQGAISILNVDYLVIWLYDDLAAQLRCAVAVVGDFSGIQRGMLFGNLFQSAVDRFNSGLHNERVIHNIRLHSATHELMPLFDGTDLRSILEVTIRLHGKNRGIIYYGQAKRQRNWSHEDVLLGRALGALVERVISDYADRQNLKKLQENNQLLEQRVSERTLELEKAYRSIEQISLLDPLTGLNNRRFLDQHMEADVGLIVRRAENDLKEKRTELKSKMDMVLFLVDLDHFKSINDKYGHASGDMVLVQLKQRLTETFRKTDYLVRWGGEEFLVVARDIQRDFVAATAERLCMTVSNTPFRIVDNISINVTCSIGFADLPFIVKQPRLFSWIQVVEIADKALYIAKHGGRNTWVGLHSHDNTNELHLTERIQQDVMQVIECGDLIMKKRQAN